MYRSQVRVLSEQCQALTVRGARCRNRALHRSNACQSHGGSLVAWIAAYVHPQFAADAAAIPAVARQLARKGNP